VALSAADFAQPASSGPIASIARNVSVMLVGQVVTFVLSFTLRAVLGRYLGDVGYGKLTFAMSITAIYATLGGLGLTPLLAKEVAREPRLAGKYLANSLLLQAAVGLPLFGGLCLLVALVKSDANTRLLTDLVGFAGLVDLLIGTTGAVFQAFEKMVYVTLGLMLEKFVTTVLSVVLLQEGYGLIAVGWVMVVAALANLLLTGGFIFRLGPLSWSVGWQSVRSLVWASTPFFLWAVFTTIYFRIDATMLSLMTTDAVTGWYGVAYALYQTLGFLPGLFKTILLPILSRLFVGDRPKFRETFGQGWYVYAVMTPPLAFGTMVLAKPIVGLIYPLSQFGNSAVDLRILGLGFIPLFYNIFLATVVVAVDKQRFWSYAAVACAFINPAVNLVLIPYYQRTMGNGGIGAAWATNLIEVFLLFVGVALLPRDLITRRDWSVAGRTFLAGGGMAGLIWWQGAQPLPVAVALGALSYVAGCYLLGVLRPSELRAMIVTWRRRRAAVALLDTVQE
jgi:O-antigen/teichoic acid export membrane protein